MKKSIMLLVSMLLLTSSFASASVSYMPYVNAEMSTAEYWANKLENPEKVLMTEDEIKELNESILLTEGTYTNDLTKYPERVNGKVLAKEWASFELPTSVLYLNGKKMTKTNYEKIRKNILNAKTSTSQKIVYGIAVNRGEMKSLPIAEPVTDDLADIEYDEFINSIVMVNEPVVIDGKTADSKFYHAVSYSCSGWVEVEDIAICKSKDEWLKAQNYEGKLVVTDDKIYLEANNFSPELSEKMFTMGTALELVSDKDKPETVDGRLTINNYVVKIPARNNSGKLEYKLGMIPVNRDVSIGYLEMTSKNILNQAFKFLGNRYGWGGIMNVDDCSLFIRDIYLCFGLNLPRNSSAQILIPSEVVALAADMSEEERVAELDKLTPGDLIQFPGHIVMFLGKDEDRYYVISDVGSFVEPESEENTTKRARSVVVNDLTVKRGNGNTWFSEMKNLVKIGK